MFRQAFSPFILLLWIVCSVAEGQVRVLGSLEPVKAHVGDSVVLPCVSSPSVDLTPLTVDWSRTELRPHPNDRLKKVPRVHVYTDFRDDDADVKIPEFINRTGLFLEQLSAGVASLRISDVTLSDNGTYKCYIPNLHRGQKRDRWATVTLLVRDLDKAATPTEPADTEPPRNDSGQASDSPAPTARANAPKVVAFVVFGVAVVVVTVVSSCPAPKKTKKPEAVRCACPDSAAPSAGGDAAVVGVENVPLNPDDLSSAIFNLTTSSRESDVADTADKRPPRAFI